MRRTPTRHLVVMAATVMLIAAGCSGDHTTEEAGRKIDSGAEKAKEATAEAAKKASDAAAKAGQAMENAAKDAAALAKDAADRAAESAREGTEAAKAASAEAAAACRTRVIKIYSLKPQSSTSLGRPRLCERRGAAGTRRK